MGVNREYKDSVFSLLFGDPETLRELYSALEGVTLESEVPIMVTTLRDVLFMDMINDLSFTVDNKLVIVIEHQSTINPNMALRLLMYIGRIYEKIISKKRLYSSKPIAVPLPEFIVLYNGTEPYPDQKTLKLSDMFIKAAHLKGADDTPPSLELEVKVYNVNKGHNEAMLQKSEKLNGYSAFIAKAREFEKTIPEQKSAITEAVKYCIEHDILKEFLELHSSEVINMLLEEWNTIEYGEVQREEGREEKAEEIAKNALVKGYSIEIIQDLTGLAPETIRSLSTQ
jgi:predicted transposase YdaD